MRKDVTEVSPGRYGLQIRLDYSLTFRNHSRYNGRVYQYIRFYVLGEFDASCY